MSVDIDWDGITSGPEGEALAETIRAFVHEKFQQVTLPGFIRSVQVHSFDFGSTCPQLEIVDIGDPLPEFYEDEAGEEEDGREEEEDGEEEEEEDDDDDDDDGGRTRQSRDSGLASSRRRDRIAVDPKTTSTTASTPDLPTPPPPPPPPPPAAAAAAASPTSRSRQRPSHIDTALPGLAIRPQFNLGDHRMGSPFPRSNTPGIPGGTSNLSYFHLPLGGLSGAQTPLAAIASGTTNLPSESIHNHNRPRQQQQETQPHVNRPFRRSAEGRDGHLISSGPSAAASLVGATTPLADDGFTQAASSPYLQSSPDFPTVLPGPPFSNPCQVPELQHANPPDSPTSPVRDPSDLQVIAHVNYTGDIRLTLTAEILLDYPMPSFVSIPLKLSITGMTFDGVAVLAWLRKNLFFCFLGEEDAGVVVGKPGHYDTSHKPGDGRAADASQGSDSAGKCNDSGAKVGRLLEEIRVESEIGRTEGGKQVLKNVGKVERFVLEQVRRIFEEEFVFPSFWTFLV